jgi:serine acetyltransferase
MSSGLHSLLQQFRQDVRLYRRLRGGSPSAGSSIVTALRSRGLWVLEAHRIIHYSTCHRGRLAWWIDHLFRPIGMYLTAVMAKSEFLADCHISEEVYLSDRGHIICGAQDIGSGSVIHDHCTLGGVAADGQTGRPVIGRNVWIGPECVIVGTLTIGDGATIRPGTFLSFNVRPNAVVEGNPARVVAESFDNTALRNSSAVSMPPSDRPG